MSKYISLENLERYDAKMQERAASFCASKEDGMWRQTDKAGAVAFYPVGNSPLEGTVEFMFKETGPASGTKSPDNPSTISGVSSIGLTVCQEEGVDEHSYTLSLGGTHYGGSIDLATGLMTVTYYGETFTQCTDKWNNFDGHTQTSSTVSFQVNPQKPHALNYRIASNMFTIGNSNTGTNEFTHRGGVGTSTFKCSIAKNVLDLSGAANPENLTTSETYSAVNSFLSAHPLFIVYEVATPFTVQLAPPQILALAQPDKYVPRLNTVYSDAENVQIVYQKNPVRDKFEKVQAIIAQGGNV